MKTIHPFAYDHDHAVTVSAEDEARLGDTDAADAEVHAFIVLDEDDKDALAELSDEHREVVAELAMLPVEDLVFLAELSQLAALDDDELAAIGLLVDVPVEDVAVLVALTDEERTALAAHVAAETAHAAEAAAEAELIEWERAAAEAAAAAEVERSAAEQHVATAPTTHAAADLTDSITESAPAAPKTRKKDAR